MPVKFRDYLARLPEERRRAIAALRELRRKRLLEGANEGYATLRNDPEAWAEELAERAAWDSTLSDDLEDE
jgi:hypothetical protein